MNQPTREEIIQQWELLRIHRKRLNSFLSRQARFGNAHVPPEVSIGINEARDEIRRTKAILRSWGQVVADHPDDDEKAFFPTYQFRSSRIPLILGSSMLIVGLAFVLLLVFILPKIGQNADATSAISSTSTASPTIPVVEPTSTPVPEPSSKPSSNKAIIGRWEHIDNSATWYKFNEDGTWIGRINGPGEVGEGTYEVTNNGKTLELRINEADGVIPYTLDIQDENMSWIAPIEEQPVLRFKKAR